MVALRPAPACSGAPSCTYQAAWFLPGVLVLFLIYKIIQERGFLRRYADTCCASARPPALSCCPALFVYHNPAIFLAAGFSG